MRARIQAITITDPALGKGGNEETYGALLYAMNQKVGDRHLPQEKPPAGMGWRPGAAKIALPIGDEPPDETLFNLAQVSKVAEELDPLHAYPILVPKQAGGTVAPGTRSSLARLARATGGEVITASSAADLPKRIVATVKLAVRRHKEEVWRKSNPPFFLFGTHALVIAGGLGMVLLAAGSHCYWLAKRRAAMAAARRSADPRLTGQSYVRPGPDASPPPSPSERG
jgi:hypothetical protein